MSEQVPEELAELWTELRPELLRQVATLRELVTACAAGSVDDALREQARSLAHQLAGSLGSFGFDAAGRAARALELRFKAGVTTTAGPALLALAAELEARLDGGPPAQPTPSREPATPAAGDASPRADAADADADATATDAPSDAAVDVVLVEDDELLGELATAALSSRGYAVRWIADGEEAVRLLTGTPPLLRARLVLLDWELPSRSGIEVLRALPDDLPVVMVTGHGEAAAVAQAQALGARGHVLKPWTVKSLAAMVREQLGR